MKAALRLLSSKDKPAVNNETTVNALRAKHLITPIERRPAAARQNYTALQITQTDFLAVFKALPAGSSGGLDGVHLQHIMDMVCNKEIGYAVIASISSFINMLLEGNCHHDLIRIFFGKRLIALEKKSSGIRPIAVGYTLHRIAAKCANNVALTVLGNKLLHEQLGLGCPGSCEAAVHATRRFMSNMLANLVITKLDFSNAFNSLRRDIMLSAVAENTTDIYRFCHIAYDKLSHLKFFAQKILSQEDAQQDDPLGPLLFCLLIHSLFLCKSHLKIAYMDYTTLGYPSHVVAADVTMIKTARAPKELILKEEKCDAITLEGKAIEPNNLFTNRRSNLCFLVHRSVKARQNITVFPTNVMIFKEQHHVLG